MILDFWNTKLNPITMLPREVGYTSISTGNSTKTVSAIYCGEDLSINPEYIDSRLATKKLGVGVVFINKQLRSAGVDPVARCSKGVSYYNINDLEIVSVIIPSKINEPVPEEFISSGDLRELLKIDSMQLFTLKHRHKWKSKKLKGHGNVSFFLKSEVLK